MKTEDKIQFLSEVSTFFIIRIFVCALLRKRIPTQELTLKRVSIKCVQKLDFISNSYKILSNKIKPLLLFVYVTSNKVFGT